MRLSSCFGRVFLPKDSGVAPSAGKASPVDHPLRELRILIPRAGQAKTIALCSVQSHSVFALNAIRHPGYIQFEPVCKGPNTISEMSLSIN